MGEELDRDLSQEGWRRAAPNEVVWIDSLGNKALTASDLRRSTLRNHWSLAATRLTTGSHWNTTTDEDGGWGSPSQSHLSRRTTPRAPEVGVVCPVRVGVAVARYSVTGKTHGRGTVPPTGRRQLNRDLGRSCSYTRGDISDVHRLVRPAGCICYTWSNER